MFKKIKRILMIVGIATIIFGLLYIQKECSTEKIIEKKTQENQIPTKTYTPPIIKIPFLSPKPPLEQVKSPIPINTIKKTITVTIPPNNREYKFNIIIDKKDNIYKSKNTPKNVKVNVTVWKPKFFAYDGRLGASILFDGVNLNYGIAFDLFRIDKFYLGTDIGITPESYSFDLGLAGISIRYPGLKMANAMVLISLGYNFLNNHFYIGGTFKW